MKSTTPSQPAAGNSQPRGILRTIKVNVILRLTIVLLLIGNLQLSAYALPPVEIRGRVVNSDGGTPLQGVSVVIAGSKKGSTTNTDGRYSISVPDRSASLLFSSVGFVAQTVPVGNQTEINISLVASSAGLDQVVVVGYGT